MVNLWPFKRREPIETRAAFPSVTAEHLAGRRAGVLSDGAVPLSATVATIAQTWSRAFAMLDANPDPNPLTAADLAAIGLDLCLRGEACFHIRVQGNSLRLVRAAYWDELGGGRYHLHIAHPASTETVRALEEYALPWAHQVRDLPRFAGVNITHRGLFIRPGEAPVEVTL